MFNTYYIKFYSKYYYTQDNSIRKTQMRLSQISVGPNCDCGTTIPKSIVPRT